ncbi:MAG: copper amine oxidase N-terminal domain-containing protein, partial [Candidatus Eremiobacteraeota bacterium]|nr:copper amine oxidase N-terminal domain-containing protein [Candidatus Eremiobacteraeota bacterium]
MKSASQQNSPLLPSRRLVLGTLVLATIASFATAFSRPASLTIDGQRVASDVPPVVTQAHEAFVPLRAVATALGADLNYDSKTSSIELVRGNDVFRMRVGDPHATFDGRKVTLRRAPFEVRGRTMVALGVIARAFGGKVSYDRARA